MARSPGILGGTTVPVWPDFGIEKLPGNVGEAYYNATSAQTIWRASTDTKRPGTPIFSIWLTTSLDISEEEARERLGARLRDEYDKAHPHGCGSR